MIAAALLIACASPVAHDGDGPIRCVGQTVKLRLDAIDAPELAGSPPCQPGDARRAKAWCDHWLGIRARDHLNQLLRAGLVTYRITGDGSWGRQSAKVYVNGRDVECAMVVAGYARVRYGRLRC